MNESNHMQCHSFSQFIDQWNKHPVAILNVDDTKVFENSIFEFYRDFH